MREIRTSGSVGGAGTEAPRRSYTGTKVETPDTAKPNLQRERPPPPGKLTFGEGRLVAARLGVRPAEGWATN